MVNATDSGKSFVTITTAFFGCASQTQAQPFYLSAIGTSFQDHGRE
jgi:hypothetical protein